MVYMQQFFFFQKTEYQCFSTSHGSMKQFIFSANEKLIKKKLKYILVLCNHKALGQNTILIFLEYLNIL